MLLAVHDRRRHNGELGAHPALKQTAAVLLRRLGRRGAVVKNALRSGARRGAPSAPAARPRGHEVRHEPMERRVFCLHVALEEALPRLGIEYLREEGARVGGGEASKKLLRVEDRHLAEEVQHLVVLTEELCPERDERPPRT